MDNKNLTAEQLRALERWEDEGGKITPALRNEQTARREIIVRRKHRVWERLDVWPGWRLV